MKQISVLVDNRRGVVAHIGQILNDRGINIESISSEAHDRKSVILLTVDQYDNALQALRDEGYDAVSEDALLIRLKDEPGALAKIAERFRFMNINIRTIQIMRREQGQCIAAIVAEDRKQAQMILSDCLIS